MIRRIQVLLLATGLAVAAYSTGAPFLFFLLYLGIVVVGGAYLLTRFGLSDLEAGYVLDRHQAEVGEFLRATYTVRNAGRLPKPWLEADNPSDLPVPLPARALALGPRAERSWAARVRLSRRGHFTVQPLVLRTGDPFGLFESSATVGGHISVVVHPRVEEIPDWRLPPAAIEGAHSQAVRTVQTTPHVTSIRPYEPGDAYNRIHWRSSARMGELQVKEFDLERTADVWLCVDLEGSVHSGREDEATIEYGVRAAAAIGARALAENRSLALMAAGARTVLLPPDRGPRQQLKLLNVLAAINADGQRPLVEVLIQSLPRLRRGMTAVVITPSLSVDWVKPLTGLRARGVGAIAVLLDAPAFEGAAAARDGAVSAPDPLAVRSARALRHTLAEYDVPAVTVLPGLSLAEQLVTTRRRSEAVAR